MANIPNTNTAGQTLVSVGNGTNASVWSKVLSSSNNNAWDFSSSSAFTVGTTYSSTFATQAITGFTKYLITVVIGGPANSGTTANTATQMFLRLHDSATGTNVVNDGPLGTLWFTSTSAYSTGAYTWSGVYTAPSTVSRTLTSFLRVSAGGCATQQISGTIIGIS